MVHPDRQLPLLLQIHHSGYLLCVVKWNYIKKLQHLPGGRKVRSVLNIRFPTLQDKDPIGIIPLENLFVRDAQYTSKPVE